MLDDGGARLQRSDVRQALLAELTWLYNTAAAQDGVNHLLDNKEEWISFRRVTAAAIGRLVMKFCKGEDEKWDMHAFQLENSLVCGLQDAEHHLRSYMRQLKDININLANSLGVQDHVAFTDLRAWWSNVLEPTWSAGYLRDVVAGPWLVRDFAVVLEHTFVGTLCPLRPKVKTFRKSACASLMVGSVAKMGRKSAPKVSGRKSVRLNPHVLRSGRVLRSGLKFN